MRNEEYDNAKQFKVRIDALRNVATKLYQLENDKRNAIAAEDYDQAKALKLEVEAIRRQAAGLSPSLPPFLHTLYRSRNTRGGILQIG